MNETQREMSLDEYIAASKLTKNHRARRELAELHIRVHDAEMELGEMADTLPPNMCREGHEEIRHDEQCPVCKLKAEVARLRKAEDGLIEHLAKAGDDVARLLLLLRGLLDTYDLEHHRHCCWLDRTSSEQKAEDYPCTCGLNDALQALDTKEADHD